MPQNPYVVRKKRARRIKKLIRWQEKQLEAEESGQKTAKVEAKPAAKAAKPAAKSPAAAKPAAAKPAKSAKPATE